VEETGECRLKVDTLAVLHACATGLGDDLASWAFLTGPPQAVQEVWQAFGLTVKWRAQGGHPAWTPLIDREGMVPYRYLGSLLEVETMVEDMRSLWSGESAMSDQRVPVSRKCLAKMSGRSVPQRRDCHRASLLPLELSWLRLAPG